MNAQIRSVLIALFGVALAVSISAALIIAALLILDWIVRSFRNEIPPTSSSSLDKPLIIFVVWTLVCYALHRRTSLLTAVSASDAFLLFFLVSRGFDERQTKLLIKWFCIASVVAGVLAFVQYFSGINYRPDDNIFQTPAFADGWPHGALRYLGVRNDRAMGTRNHPLTYAEGLIPAFIVLLFWMFSPKDETKAKRVMVVGALGVMALLGGLFLSQSRGVILGIFTAIIIVGLLPPRLPKIRRLIALALVLVSAVLVVSPAARGRVLSSFSTHYGTAGDQKSKETRYALWRASLEELKAHPLVGVGPKAAEITVGHVWTETHNIYLQIALEGGLIGLGLLLWIFVLIFKETARLTPLWRKAAQCVLLAFLIAGLTESWTNDKEISLIFWTAIGCISRL
jgi:O-antigen ligase